uniref:Uncharacterized protein n=1 Tax=Amphimedon queenslandica TaxID=400682 RepID=A0A1X7U3W2_AMPQE
MMFVAIFLLFLYPVLSAAADIYVSSSDGINNTSCWTGGVQTPCATIDLAIQGAATPVERGGVQILRNNSGIVIYLLPGTYTSTVLEEKLIRNNVSKLSIISMRNEQPQCCPQSECYYWYYGGFCNCDYLKFTANVIDQCTGEKFDWKNELKSDYNLLSNSDTNYQMYDLYASPSNVFNLDFTPFLGAISFWYVVGFYPLFLLLLLYVWITCYITYQLSWMLVHCDDYRRRHYGTIRIQEQEYQPLVGNDDDWIADRMENPQEYNELHVPVRLDDLPVEYDPQDNTVAANYGSINAYETVRTED